MDENISKKISPITTLLDEMEEILDESRAVPFSKNVAVCKEDFYEILGEIRAKIPSEIKQSMWVLEERNKILIDAQKEASEIIKNAEEKVARMIDENEVTKRAYEQAGEIVEESKATAKEMRIGSNEYADEVLGLAEEKLKEMLDRVRNEYNEIEALLNENISVIMENRQELRGMK